MSIIDHYDENIERLEAENAKLQYDLDMCKMCCDLYEDELKGFHVEREAMMKQEPLGFVQSYVVDTGLNGFTATLNPVQEGKYTVPVFLQSLPAQQIPEGYALVPIEPTPEMEIAFQKGCGLEGWFYQGYEYMLSASQKR
jgi:hypothetical protein